MPALLKTEKLLEYKNNTRKRIFKKQLEQIWQMSDGVTELIAEKEVF